MDRFFETARKHPLVSDSLVILFVAAVAYLPFIFQLGYYHDDWFPVVSQISGVGIVQMHSVDRPIKGLVYWVVNQMLGTGALPYHFFAFFLRVAGGLLVLWMLRVLWPKQRMASLLVTLLFVIYPGFLLQTNAVEYQNHFISLDISLLSLGLMLLSWSFPIGIRRTLITLGSAFLIPLYAGIYEATLGIEGLRVVLIWYLAQPKDRALVRRRIRHALVTWLPYLALAGAFMIWRMLIFHSARDSVDAGSLLQNYRSNLLSMLLRLAFEIGKDLLEATFSAWMIPAYRLVNWMSYGRLAISLALAVWVVVVLRVYWSAELRTPAAELMVLEREEQGWALDAIRLGLTSTILTLLPMILSDRNIQFTYNLDRYTLQTMFPAALLIVGLAYYAFRHTMRFWFPVVLIAMAIITHYGNGAFYRDYWQAEKDFWWQLSWRAPQIKTGTALVAVLPGDFSLAEGYEIWGPANAIYRPGQPGIYITGAVLNDESAREIIHGLDYNVSMRKNRYTVDFKNALVASLPGNGACLHVIDGNRVELTENEAPLVRQVARFSRTDLIVPGADQAQPPPLIFGTEPERGWCYYYQKAELARQQQNWKEIARLGNEAAQRGLEPADVSEWMPFYEAYARLGDLDQSNELGGLIRGNSNVVLDLCDQYDPNLSFNPFRPQSNIEKYIVNNLCAK